MERICYWCGKEAASDEHVPSKGLFPPGHRKNLLTVPSCFSHNNAFGETDDKVRVYLQAAQSNQVALAAWKDKTIRGLNRPESRGFANELADSSVAIEEPDGNIVGGVFAARGTLLQPYFEKTTRALYFHLTGRPSLDCEVRYYSRNFFGRDDLPKLDLLERTFQELSSEVGPGENPEVFQWRTKTTGSFFVLEMIFYEGVVVYGLIDLRQLKQAVGEG